MFEPIKVKNDKNILPPKTHAVNHSSALKHEESRSAAKQDMADLSKDWQNRTDWYVRTKETLEQLQQSYPNISILLSENLKEGALALTAASLGPGTHLILSEDFLNEMGKSQESYEKYKNILVKVLSQLAADSKKHDGNGAYLTKDHQTGWHATRTKEPEVPSKNTLPKYDFMMSASGKTGKDSTAGLDYRLKAKPSYRTAGSYAKMASASTKSRVRTVLGDVQRNIATLRIASVYGEEKDRIKVKKAIASLNKLLLRGNQKLRRLTSEEITALRKKRAERQENERKAARIKAELAKKRVDRNTADGALVKEGCLDDIGRDYYYKKYKAYEYGLPHSTAPVSPTLDIPASGLSPSDTLQAFTPSEVTVSDSIAFE